MSHDSADSSRATLIAALVEAATREEAIINSLVAAVQRNDQKGVLRAARLLAAHRTNSKEDQSYDRHE